MLTAIGSALVAASAGNKMAPKTRTIQVTSSFKYGGQIRRAGDVLDAHELFAAEAVTTNKARYVAPEAPPEPSEAQKVNAKYGGRASTRFKSGGVPPAEPVGPAAT